MSKRQAAIWRVFISNSCFNYILDHKGTIMLYYPTKFWGNMSLTCKSSRLALTNHSLHNDLKDPFYWIWHPLKSTVDCYHIAANVRWIITKWITDSEDLPIIISQVECWQLHFTRPVTPFKISIVKVTFVNVNTLFNSNLP